MDTNPAASTNLSEVARLRSQIEAECLAAQRGLHAPAIAGRHAFISARYDAMEAPMARLTQLVGSEQAGQMICEIIDATLAPEPTTANRTRGKPDRRH